MHLVFLGLSTAVLLGTLITAVIGHHRVPPVAIALPGAACLVLVGALSTADAESAAREITPTVAFLVVVLLLADLADREGLFTWAAAVTARQAGRSPRGLLARVAAAGRRRSAASGGSSRRRPAGTRHRVDPTG